VRREQKLDELTHTATQEPERAAITTSVDQLEQQLSTISREQRHHGVGQRLFEAKECVTQNIEDSDRDREAPQTSETVRSIIHLIRSHC
jgi:hypothetical protein